MENELLAKWEEFKALVEVLDKDVAKTAKGNKAAGVRSRKTLRDLKKRAAVLVRDSVAVAKALKADKSSEKSE